MWLDAIEGTDGMTASGGPRRRPSYLTLVGCAVAGLVACRSGSAGSEPAATPVIGGPTNSSLAASSDTFTPAKGRGELFDNSIVHDVDVSFAQSDYEELIADYRADSTKSWIEATVTIDGTVLRRAGIRLKGNSSLFGLRNGPGGQGAGGAFGRGPGGGATADSPNALPWLVRLDKFVPRQNFKGVAEFVVRSNNTQTSLNEAVALELLGLTGQVTQRAFATRFSVNDGPERLRLVVENPGPEWDEANFTGDGLLYKAGSGGDYSYRGDDPTVYDEIFEQEAGDKPDLGPLIAFLKFINTADDATFAADLSKHLEVDAFARYLAGQALVQNYDDIDGPGNNSYLRYDAKTGRITIISWDLNLSFGGMGGGTPNQPSAPPNAPAPANGPASAAPRPAGFGARANILVNRFLADPKFKAAYDSALTSQKSSLFATGRAAEVLERWKGILSSQVVDLVPVATIEREASTIARFFTP